MATPITKKQIESLEELDRGLSNMKILLQVFINDNDLERINNLLRSGIKFFQDINEQLKRERSWV